MFTLFLSALLFCGLGSVAQAADSTLRLTWENLGKHTQGKHINTVLSDGTTLGGRVLAIEPDTLVLKVSHSSDRARFHAKAQVPRPLFSSLQVSRNGWKWKTILIPVGALGGAAVGGVIGSRVDPNGFIISDGAANGVIFGALGASAIGYLIGRHLDNKRLQIDIVK